VEGGGVMDDYTTFLASKSPRVQAAGITIDESDLHPMLFGFQRAVVAWALRRGRAALFLECGLGKTFLQIEWAAHISQHTGRPVLILAPLAVAQQTKREGQRFGYTVTLCRSQADVRPGINVANYEMLDHFMPAAFTGVVLDESGILKSYSGSTKKQLIDAFARTPYRLCCTATPAPNDHMEIGNHAEFLGIMPSPEMLSRWFINDTTNMGTYRLKGHARQAFWEWISSWAVSARRPSDLGFPDEGYDLPPLRLHEVNVPVDRTEDAGAYLFRLPEMNATGLHAEMRRTAPARAQIAADLVNGQSGPWLVWCNTNYEADALLALLPDATEVRGSESIEAKERKIDAFITGQTRVLITKPSLAGWGLNLQHCHQVVFVGLSYSFEALYQAVRRSYRFGQQHLVDAYLLVAETEDAVLTAVRRKMAAHEEMLDEMSRAAGALTLQSGLRLVPYTPQGDLFIPDWLRSVC